MYNNSLVTLTVLEQVIYPRIYKSLRVKVQNLQTISLSLSLFLTVRIYLYSYTYTRLGQQLNSPSVLLIVYERRVIARTHIQRQTIRRRRRRRRVLHLKLSQGSTGGHRRCHRITVGPRGSKQQYEPFCYSKNTSTLQPRVYYYNIRESS